MKHFNRGENNGRYRHGLCKTRLYRIFGNIKQRCYYKNNKDYKNYGGRGIIVCDEWLKDFKKFYDWAINNGYQDGLTIDRINNDGNYEPSNCRWITKKAQSRNNRNNRIITYKGETHCLIEWSEILKIPYPTLRSRIQMNLPDNMVLKK